MVTANPKVESHYEALECSWNVVDGALHFERLVVPTGNAASGYHRWFHLKEAYSAEMLDTILKKMGKDGSDHLRILDCFAGGGTTIVSALKSSTQFPEGVNAVGIERNPFLFHVSNAKVRALLAGKPLAEQLRESADWVHAAYKGQQEFPFTVPPLTTLSNEDYFPKESLLSLLRLKSSIQNTLNDGLVRDLILMAAASSVEAASRLRRDGRALRYTADRSPKDPWEEFTLRIAKVIEDVEDAPKIRGSARLIEGDGRFPSKYIGDAIKQDLIIFSPPYPNNIDYTEIYKMEAWYLDCYSSLNEFRSQRLSTVRSHPSVRFAEDYSYLTSPMCVEVENLIAPLIEAVPRDRYEWGRLQLVRGYVDDMLTLFLECRKLIADDGRLVFVVGNSAHGNAESRFIIAADLLMARLAELAGWRVEEIAVARNLHRRMTKSDFLRESVVTIAPA